MKFDSTFAIDASQVFYLKIQSRWRQRGLLGLPTVDVS